MFSIRWWILVQLRAHCQIVNHVLIFESYYMPFIPFEQCNERTQQGTVPTLEDTIYKCNVSWVCRHLRATLLKHYYTMTRTRTRTTTTTTTTTILTKSILPAYKSKRTRTHNECNPPSLTQTLTAANSRTKPMEQNRTYSILSQHLTWNSSNSSICVYFTEAGKQCPLRLPLRCSSPLLRKRIYTQEIGQLSPWWEISLTKWNVLNFKCIPFLHWNSHLRCNTPYIFCLNNYLSFPFNISNMK